MDPLVNMQTLGERLLLLRRRAGLSQSTLAQRAGIDTMTVSRIESGHKKRLELETAARLAHVFGISLDQLCGREATPAEQPSLSSTSPCPEPDPTLERFKRWKSGSEAQNVFVAHLMHWHEVEGMSIQAITQRLNAAGIPTRSGRGQWFQPSVSELLQMHTSRLKGKKARKDFMATYGPGRYTEEDTPAPQPTKRQRTRKAAPVG